MNIDFDTATKKLATSCTPSSLKVTQSVYKIPLVSSFTPDQALYIDPKGTYTMAGSLADSAGDCTNATNTINSQPPTIGTPTFSPATSGATSYTLNVTASASGTNTIASVSFTIGSKTISATDNGNGTYSATVTTMPTAGTDYATATDSASNSTTAKF